MPSFPITIRPAFSREGEARVVETLCRAPGFIPILSPIAETDGRFIGYIGAGGTAIHSPAIVLLDENPEA